MRVEAPTSTHIVWSQQSPTPGPPANAVRDVPSAPYVCLEAVEVKTTRHAESELWATGACYLAAMMVSSVIARLTKAVEVRLLPPRVYVQLEFGRRVGKPLRLAKPATFSEKIQWLKLYFRDPRMSRYADKVEVKEVVDAIAGSEYVIPSERVWDRADEIALEGLPMPCILKATHGSGWNLIVRDATRQSQGEVSQYFRFWLRKDYYRYSKEWAYKGIRPRVLCERLLVDDFGEVPNDYKVFCFGGVPRFVQVDHDRFTNHTRSFFDTSWSRQDFSIGYPMSTKEVARPSVLDKMLSVSSALSSSFPFLRVDFLLLREQCYVNELTFYPGNGMEVFSDPTWDQSLGDLLQLPSI